MKMSNLIAHRNDLTIDDDLGIVEIRSKICDYTLLAMALIAIPLLITSLLRSQDTGWQSIYYFHVATVISMWSIWVFRTYLPYGIRSYFVFFFFGYMRRPGGCSPARGPSLGARQSAAAWYFTYTLYMPT